MKKQELKINVPIPEGMVLKSVKSEIKDGVVVVIPEYEENPKYKDGDIVFEEWTSGYAIGIVRGEFCSNSEQEYYAYINRKSDLYIRDSVGCLFRKTDRFATKEEKQKLFDVLAKNGYKWNAETKELEKVLPRVPKGEKFFAFCGTLEVFQREEERDLLCDGYYKAGNYFLTEEEAEKAAKKAKEAIKR